MRSAYSMGLENILSRYSRSGASASGASLTDSEIAALERELGVEINRTGETDMGLDFSDFMQLMIVQLQNQTIDNATDTTDMMNQMVQMSVVQMLSTVQTSIETLTDASTMSYAASLVGKTVTVGQYDAEGNITEVVGTVTGTGTYQGTHVIFVDGEMYALNSIMAVGTLPEIPDEGGDAGDTGESGETGETGGVEGGEST